MKNKYKIFHYIVLFFMLGIITACGATNEKASTKSEKNKEGKQYTIGVTQIVEHPSLDAAFDGFKKALEDNGLKEGENLTFDVQIAQGDMSNNQSIANNLKSKNVDLIFANSTPSAQGALSATKDIPIIFTSVTDPVGAQLVASMENPGGNVTGTTDTHPEAIPNTIKFIKEQFNVKKIGTIYNSGEQNSVAQIEMVEKELKGTGIELVKVTVSTSSEVQQAADSLKGRADAIYIIGDNTVVTALESVVKLAKDQKIPLFVGELDSVKRGGFAAYGFEYYDIGYEAGEMAAQILKGEKTPAEMPVQYPQNLKLLINKDSAKEIDIKIKEEWNNIAEYYEN
ncbi:ABC transporter substrate-binding protein [Neobacillus sp. D3-1R]|uniref:ABC transporter substrate-binding protein n=1 Tax=Neobacillus sp. D3-1R TaxID=3445778 RepID=UPI003F9F89C9